MYGPRNAAGFSVQATRKKSSSERTKFVVISEKFRLLRSVYIWTVQFRAAIESAGNEEDKRCQQRSRLSKQRSRLMDTEVQ